MYQHIDMPTRARKDAVPSILNLVIAKSVDDVLNRDFRALLGKCDHVVLDIYVNTNLQRQGVDPLKYVILMQIINQ